MDVAALESKTSSVCLMKNALEEDRRHWKIAEEKEGRESRVVQNESVGLCGVTFSK